MVHFIIYIHLIQGRIATLEIDVDSRTLVYQNGDLPTRYKSSFESKRGDRICAFWKLPLARVKITYIAPHQLLPIRVLNGKVLLGVKADVYPVSYGKECRIYARKVGTETRIGYLNYSNGGEVGNMLEGVCGDEALGDWTVLYEGQVNTSENGRTNAYFHDSVSDTVTLSSRFEEGEYLIYCRECRIVLRGTIVDV